MGLYPDLLAGFGSLTLGVGFYSFVLERKWVDFRRVEVKHPSLPSVFDGFKIALFSDVHWGFFLSYKFLRKSINAIQFGQPDMICFTGDLIDSQKSLSTLSEFIPLLAKLQAPFGKFAVVGNHDYRAGVKQVIHSLKAGGFTVLQNEHHVIQRGKNRLHIIGLDDALEGDPNPMQAVAGMCNDGFHLVLVHEPDYALLNRHSYPFHFQLSGHSHGGQCRLPGIGPLLTSHLGRTFHTGLNVKRNFQVYTNRGLGTTFLPVRFLCRPEITFLTLRCVK
jgi:uncharacterized protein